MPAHLTDCQRKTSGLRARTFVERSDEPHFEGELEDVEEDVVRQRGDDWRRDGHLVQAQMMPEGESTGLISGTRAEVTVWRLQESRTDRRSQYGT